MAESPLQKVLRLARVDPGYVELFNPNHDDKGEFASGGSAGWQNTTPPGSSFHAYHANVTTASGRQLHLQVFGGPGKNHGWSVHEGHSFARGLMPTKFRPVANGGADGMTSTQAKTQAETAARAA